MKNNYQKIDKLSPKQKRLLLAKIPPVNFPLLDRELIYYQQAIAKKLRRGLAGASAAAPQRKPSKETGGIASRRGENAQAMNYLSTQIKTRNQQKLDELKTYLSKHES
ncbi:MAG: hypothetical protein QNJ33_17385, partial [Crocosphaera sp.]|nr:hypothetical protein [Crocosphaera sp.]